MSVQFLREKERKKSEMRQNFQNKSVFSSIAIGESEKFTTFGNSWTNISLFLVILYSKHFNEFTESQAYTILLIVPLFLTFLQYELSKAILYTEFDSSEAAAAPCVW